MADKNEAQIVIKTINDTDGGFKEVASNFEDFDKEIQNLEKNLKPLQTLLDAGIASGAGVSAVGAYTKNLGDIDGDFEVSKMDENRENKKAISWSVELVPTWRGRPFTITPHTASAG